MTRNTAREIATHLAYELSFTDLPVETFLNERLSPDHFAELNDECESYGQVLGEVQEQYIRRVISGVAEHAAELDTYIEKYARDWRFERISLVAAAIMRVAMFEILYMPDIPNSVAINEAVVIAKRYEEPETVRFVNGILGSFLRGEIKES
jgi:N utilization substance protein B